MNLENSQKGITLYFSIIMLALLLAMVLGVTSVLVSGIKIVQGMGNSVLAFHAADTGIEHALYNLRVAGLTDDISEIPLDNGAKYEVNITPADGDCSAPNYCIKSTGTYSNTKRAIEANY